MPSAFEATAADEFARCHLATFGQTVVRRIGGRNDRTQSIQAIVDLDEKLSAKIAIDRGGLTDNATGRFTDEAGYLDLKADQEYSMADTWVIDGKVFKTHGETVGRDAGCVTIIITRRTNKLARQPRVSG